MKDSREDNLCEYQYGEWLRINMPRREWAGDKADFWLRKKSEPASVLGMHQVALGKHRAEGEWCRELVGKMDKAKDSLNKQKEGDIQVIGDGEAHNKEGGS